MKYASAFARNCGFAIRTLDGTEVASSALPTDEASADILVIKDAVQSSGPRTHRLPFGVKTVLSGEEACLLGGRRLRLKPGSIPLMPAGAEVCSTVQKTATSLSVHFPIALASYFLFEDFDGKPELRAIGAPSTLLQDLPICVRRGSEAMMSALYAIHDTSCATTVFDLCMNLYDHSAGRSGS